MHSYLVITLCPCIVGQKVVEKHSAKQRDTYCCSCLCKSSSTSTVVIIIHSLSAGDKSQRRAAHLYESVGLARPNASSQSVGEAAWCLGVSSDVVETEARSNHRFELDGQGSLLRVRALRSHAATAAPAVR